MMWNAFLALALIFPTFVQADIEPVEQTAVEDADDTGVVYEELSAGTAPYVSSGATAPSQYAAPSGNSLSGEYDEGLAGKISAEYFAVFYGPAIGKPTAYQPTPYGTKDVDHPVVLRNFVGLGYNVTDEISITPTASWHWSPIGRSVFTLQDPYIRVSDTSVWSSSQANLYSDVRLHLPVTRISQEQQMRAGVQTFNSFVFDIPTTSISLGAYASARFNFFGQLAYGNDLELYLAPNVNYQYSDNASIILVYEMNAVHVLGTKAWTLDNSGTALQPGMAWLVTPELMVNPFLNLTTGGKVNLETTSLGLNVSYRMI